MCGQHLRIVCVEQLGRGDRIADLECQAAGVQTDSRCIITPVLIFLRRWAGVGVQQGVQQRSRLISQILGHMLDVSCKPVLINGILDLSQRLSDGATGRVLTTQILPDNANLTMESCVASCDALNFTIAGGEFSVSAPVPIDPTRVTDKCI
jgi:hypothetical protein